MSLDFRYSIPTLVFLVWYFVTLVWLWYSQPSILSIESKPFTKKHYELEVSIISELCRGLVETKMSKIFSRSNQSYLNRNFKI